MDSELLKYEIALTLISGIGAKTARKLLTYFERAENIFKAKKTELLNAPGFQKKHLQELAKEDYIIKAEKQIDYCLKNDIQILHLKDKCYPYRLKHIDDAPVVLYYKGNADLNSLKAISIVGTRKASPLGLQLCEELIKNLSDKGFMPLIISGLAYGIDVCAHKTALKYNLPTIAVMGTGMNKIYPASHRGIAQQIIKNGGLLTEFGINALLDAGNFVSRNRIIAGLSEATIVVESPSKGGSLLTASFAFGYNREVMTFPGRPNDNSFKGCNMLIKSNVASLIENDQDIIKILNWHTAEKKRQIQRKLFHQMTETEQLIMDILSEKEKMFIDELSYKTNIPVGKLNTILLTLEFDGLVKSLPGSFFMAIVK